MPLNEPVASSSINLAAAGGRNDVQNRDIVKRFLRGLKLYETIDESVICGIDVVEEWC